MVIIDESILDLSVPALRKYGYGNNKCTIG